MQRWGWGKEKGRPRDTDSLLPIRMQSGGQRSCAGRLAGLPLGAQLSLGNGCSLPQRFFFLFAMQFRLCDPHSPPRPSAVKVGSPNHWTSREFLSNTVSK